MTGNIFLVILITSLATFLSRFLGVVSSENIKVKNYQVINYLVNKI